MITITKNIYTRPWTGSYRKAMEAARVAGDTRPALSLQMKENRVILDLYEAGVWQKTALFYSFANILGAGWSFYNWKDASVYKITESGTNTFTNNQGFKSASSSYLNTNYPVNAMVGFATNFSVVSQVANSSTTNGSLSLYGVRGTYNASENRTLLFRPLTSGSLGSYYNYRGNSDPTTFSNNNQQGMYHQRRNGSAHSMFKAGTETTDTNSGVSTPDYTSPLTLLTYNGYNVNGGAGGITPGSYYTPANLAHFALFTALTDQEWSDYQTIWYTNHFSTL
jgi:hypothetical protein